MSTNSSPGPRGGWDATSCSAAGRTSGYYRDQNGTVTAFHHTPGYETYRGLGWYGVILQGAADAR